MKVRQLLKDLIEDGWYLDTHRGTSHRQLKHPVKKGKVTVAGNPGDEVPKGTLHRTLKQAGLKRVCIEVERVDDGTPLKGGSIDRVDFHDGAPFNAERPRFS